MSTNRYLARAGSVAAVLGAAVLLGSGVASAHVTAKVLGEPAAKGGYTKITFRVPNEDEKAGTVKLQVSIAAKYAIAAVRTKPTPGWTATVTTTALNPPVRNGDSTVDTAVTAVTWTAAKGTRIGPDQFGEFEISAGRLPQDTDQLVLPARQTYDNGTVVDWNQPTPAGGEEPEHPAPTLALTAALPGDGDGDMAGMGGGQQAGPATAADTGGTSHSTAAPVTGTDTAARWLGGAGLAVGALGLGIGIGATLRARRATAAGPAAANEQP